MRRRTFIVLLGGSATVPLLQGAALAEGKTVTIGVLVTGHPSIDIVTRGLRDALAKIGWIEGQNLRLVPRSGQGDVLQELAAELVRMKVDVIVTSLTPTAQAAKKATTQIPIVMAAAGDPVGTGLVASLARPGGNVTGVTTAGTEVAAKSLELIREMFPSWRRVGVIANENDTFTGPYVAQLRDGARRTGLELEVLMAHPTAAQEPIFQALIARKADAVIIQGSMVRTGSTVDLAIEYRMPSLGSNRSWPMTGGLMSYAASLSEVYRQSADYIDKVIKGRPPAELPVALVTKFDLVINLKAAKALGLTVPESFLARADEVIE